MITRRNKLYLIGFGVVGIIFIVRFLSWYCTKPKDWV